MKRRVSKPPLGSEYDKFLFAPIGDDRNGMTVSVVSLLGRMDLDPWEEAATLAALPAESAAQKLAVLLRALPDQSPLKRDADGTAARLIALLPKWVSTVARTFCSKRCAERTAPEWDCDQIDVDGWTRDA